MSDCLYCQKSVRENARYCPYCGQSMALEGLLQTAGEEDSAVQNFKKSVSPKVVYFVLAFIALLVLIAAFASMGSGGSNNDSSGSVSVDEFYCSFGTQTASVVVSSSASETVYAYVTVGLYVDGTLQHSATDYEYVEPGGQSLINVSLYPYSFMVGDCRVIDVGY